ncbi:MAG: hypothetical protein ACR2HD_03265 [Solirubrobacteraceae bacterium]|nr:MAG: hypothetical protein DLM63_11870 [Solirubrobacterales bacterium]
MLALSKANLEGILGLLVIVAGFAICAALWYLMVWRPSRAERRERLARESGRSQDPRADGPTRG